MPEAAVWSPISPILANLLMEEFETKAFNITANPLRWWRRYIDDTFVIEKTTQRDLSLHHTNSIDPHIQFTREDPNTDGSMPFMDTLVMPGTDNTLLTTVYRRSTHTDQYLYWDSHHSLSAKVSSGVDLLEIL